MKILNGFPLNNEKNIQYFNDIQDLSEELTYNKLNELGVSYIVVHLDKFNEGIIPKPIKKYFGFELESKSFNFNSPLIINKNFIKVYEDNAIQIFKL